MMIGGRCKAQVAVAYLHTYAIMYIYTYMNIGVYACFTYGTAYMIVETNLCINVQLINNVIRQNIIFKLCHLQIYVNKYIKLNILKYL